MKKIFFTTLLLISAVIVFSQERRSIGFDGILSFNGNVIKNSSVTCLVSIVPGSMNEVPIYTERQMAITDSTGRYHLEIGNGIVVKGQYDSIIWSDGVIYLRTEFDAVPGMKQPITRNILLRIPPELKNDFEQGTVLSTEFLDHGEWKFPNTRNKRPRLVTVDLTTSYANLAYPANTYPIYRHYEWCDPERDGTGNSFIISYSEKTNNYFIENTNKLGDVRLYPKAFQELTISSTNAEILISISKPVPIKNLSETYGIKGPWKFIYYIEW